MLAEPRAPAETSNAWVVAPAFNEAAVIGETLDALLPCFSNVVVVDDCSRDATGAIAAAAGAHVCRHPINLGQGAALQTGIDYALGRGADYIVTFDADGQHRPEDAQAMLAELLRREVDVMLASRFLGSAEGIPGARRTMLRLATYSTTLTTGLALTDTHNGLRVIRRAAAQRIRLRQNRMAHASEFLDQIALHGLSYAEHPVTIVYTDYSKSKGQRMSGVFAVMSDLYLRRMYK